MSIWLDNLITCVLGIWIGGAIMCFIAFITSPGNGCNEQSVLRDLLSGPKLWTQAMWHILFLMFVGAVIWPIGFAFIYINKRR